MHIYRHQNGKCNIKLCINREKDLKPKYFKYLFATHYKKRKITYVVVVVVVMCKIPKKIIFIEINFFFISFFLHFNAFCFNFFHVVLFIFFYQIESNNCYNKKCD